jgi:MarR family transcriptional regulator, organic hydroperoxide resistance regulator
MPRSIQDDIKQTRPFRSRAQEATVALLRTANLLRRRFEAAAQTEGLTFQQYNVLRILRGARTPLPTMEIAERLVEEAPGITRLVNSLEERGLLRREQWAGDRRQMLCQLSPAGARLLDKLDAAIDDLDERTGAGLADADLERLVDVLARIREAAAGETAPPSRRGRRTTSNHRA